MPIKKATNAIVNSEVVDFNMILSAIIKTQKKLALDLKNARHRIIELEAQIAQLTQAQNV